MIKIGLTGGIGSGKSTVSAMIKAAGYNIVDADVITKFVLKEYPEILNKVEDEFGSGFFDWQGNFRAREFGNHIFRFPKERKKYEAIIMPYIIKELNAEIDKHEKQGEDIVIIDAPTLIENNMHEQMDYVVLVWVDTSTQIARVKSRDKMLSSDVINRINSQMSIDHKKEFSDFIINNTGTIMDTKGQVDKLLEYFNVLKKNVKGKK